VAYKGSPKYVLEQMKTQTTFEEMDTEERECVFPQTMTLKIQLFRTGF